jgi:hypothetical protein
MKHESFVSATLPMVDDGSGCLKTMQIPRAPTYVALGAVAASENQSMQV